MEIEWDERKRLANIAKHRLDFEDVVLVLDSDKVLRLLARPAGEEVRYRAIGYVRGIPVAVIYTERGTAIRVISMRRARDDERRILLEALQRS
jgi:uncharacterized DUF497 family protein